MAALRKAGLLSFIVGRNGKQSILELPPAYFP
jgi:hypothetical protein